jgi:hypothetical protein
MDLNIPTDIWNQTPEGVRDLVSKLVDYSETLQNAVQTYEQQLGVLLQTLTNHQNEIQILRSTGGDSTFTSSIFNALCKLSEHIRNRPKSPNTVVFVCPHPVSRQLKLAYGLRKQGWNVILITKQPPSGVIALSQQLENIFNEIHHYSHTLEAVAISLSLSPVAYHCFSSWDFELTEHMIRVRPGKIVFDDYDLLSGALEPETAKEYAKILPAERFCFENADGICNRSLTLQLAKKQFKVADKSNFFPEYCWNGVFPKKPKRTDGVHFVYVGDISEGHFNDPLESFCCDRKFIEMITRHGFHYHLYPTRSSKQSNGGQGSQHYHYSLENPLFHLHEPIPYLNLIEEISQYHFGVCVCSKRAISDGNFAYNAAPYRYHLNNKVFDYIDAGLIPLVSGGPTMHWFFRRLHAAEIVHRDEIDALLQRIAEGENFEHITRGVQRAQHVYDVARQARRLGQFYQSLQ